MDAKCPICGTMFDERKLPEHLAADHKPSIDPEINEARALAHHSCPFCHADLPTPEELKRHIGSVHGK